MKSHDAQPDNLPDEAMVYLLGRGITTLFSTRRLLDNYRPTRRQKDAIRRDLAGVIADLETIRLGLS